MFTVAFYQNLEISFVDNLYQKIRESGIEPLDGGEYRVVPESVLNLLAHNNKEPIPVKIGLTRIPCLLTSLVDWKEFFGYGPHSLSHLDLSNQARKECARSIFWSQSEILIINGNSVLAVHRFLVLRTRAERRASIVWLPHCLILLRMSSLPIIASLWIHSQLDRGNKHEKIVFQTHRKEGVTNGVVVH